MGCGWARELPRNKVDPGFIYEGTPRGKPAISCRPLALSMIVMDFVTVFANKIHHDLE
jgi:hypothetical protein